VPRRRLGVALLLEPPLAAEVDGLRRALGDPALDRVTPHLTLVPPLNVAEAELPAALGLLRRAASVPAGPLEVLLGPPATFLPDNPVLYLQVSGEPEALDRLRRLRDAVLSGPLERPLSWPWVPHVTLADDLVPAAIDAALAVLGHFRATARFERVVLLEEQGRPRRWVPLADVRLGPRSVVGRGGLELELTLGCLVDPQAAALLALLPEGEVALPDGARVAVVCTARRAGSVVGVGAAWYEEWRGYLGVAVHPDHRHQGIGTHVLARLESVLIEEGWAGADLEPLGPPAFYQGRSRTARARFGPSPQSMPE
jgi:2'-5' RNA ligase/GNAT superfamily N-acetyltransferase